MRGVIFLSIFDWWCHSHGHSDIQLARALAQRTPVLFVNSVGMRLPRLGSASAPIKRIIRKLQSTARLIRIPDRALDLTVFTPLSLPIYSGPLEPVIRNFLKLQISVLSNALKFKEPMVIVTVPTFARVALSLNCESLMYYRSDLHSAFEEADGDMLRANESLLFQKSDAVLYSGKQLFEEERNRLNGRAHLIGHGINTSLFTPDGPTAVELDAVPRPRVGFFGDLRKRSVDFDLIAETAALCPTIQFVLGGTQLDGLGRLKQLPNVHIFPPCPHEQMPARWRSIDVAILPYGRSIWLDASEPIKLNEILATGLLAVGTPLPALRHWPGYVEVAESSADFAAAINRALITGDSQEAMCSGRRAQVGMSSWDAIADRLLSLSRAIGTPAGADLALPASRSA